MTEIETTAEALENAAMTRARAVHTDATAPRTCEFEPLPEELARTRSEDKSPAQWAYERLLLYVQNFEQQLREDEEVALGLTGGEAGVLKIEGIGYFAPDILTFYGTNTGGARTQLIQHVGKLDVMLVAQPKAQETEPARRIGFHLARALEESASEPAPADPQPADPASTKPQE
ncbi:hypothetical protein DL1_06665 [Thioclava dalianensis]|uniref:Uncharacterized protein n=1 Tax=Thioclava dalianensis TaxID=1185766 RepID=A0A074TQQ1_9RHOB|nr:DUF6173 family protein [Thioclava dalianensis]KEP71273.1 hypothetical protein DL1_06665 [Thioclava dalianensis]SFM76044.1 hypothetical protein SAMN05216224_101179 [Thioclava dalianensis]